MATWHEVRDAFLAANDGGDDVDLSRELLAKRLAPLMGGSGGTSFSPIIFTQASPATTWGPIPHSLGRPVSVETIGPGGEEFDCTVINAPSFDSVTIHLGLALAGKAIIF